MATMTVSLPDPLKEWIEAQVQHGDYASASDYVSDLVRRDRVRREPELTEDQLRRKLAASRESGPTSRSVDAIFAEAREIAGTRRMASVSLPSSTSAAFADCCGVDPGRRIAEPGVVRPTPTYLP